MFRLSKKMFLGVLVLTFFTKERANEIAQELIKKGELSQSESKEFVINILDRAEKEKDKLIEKIKPEINKKLEKMNFAIKKYIDNLEKRLMTWKIKLNNCPRK